MAEMMLLLGLNHVYSTLLWFKLNFLIQLFLICNAFSINYAQNPTLNNEVT